MADTYPFDDAREIVQSWEDRLAEHTDEAMFSRDEFLRVIEYIHALEQEASAGAFMLWNHGMLPEISEADDAE